MKKIFISAAFIAAGLMATSCSEDLLDLQQKGTGNTVDFYNGSDESAKAAITSMYATYAGEICGTEGIWNAYLTGINYSADDIFSAGGDTKDHADFRIMDEMRYDATSLPVTNLYKHIYKSIYTANLVISYFGGDVANTPVKKQAVAEARVMRAWAHMLAAQVYDIPPLIDHLVTTDKPTNAESAKSIFDWCEKECMEAANDLPERPSKDNKEGAWYVTKGFAQFVAGKCALFAGDYAKAAADIKPLVESDKYALVPGERFRDLFHVEGDGCEEKIFEINYVTNTGPAGGADSWREGNNRGRWMVANVFNWRGDDIAGGGKSPLICSTGGWGGASIQHNFAHKMLANDGDSYRRKATFLTSDEFFYDEKLCGWVSDAECKTLEAKQFDPKRGIINTNGSFSRSDVMEVKMMMHPNDANLAVGDNCNNTNVCFARLAEAYLIYAEACIKNGNLDEAKKYINKIQERAGSKTISETVDMQVLMDEKQYELWFEGCRWFDIVRWGIAQDCYDKVLDNIPYQFDEYFTSGGKKPHKLYYEVRHPLSADGINVKFQAKNQHWPIPQSILDMNPQMHQTDAWK